MGKMLFLRTCNADGTSRNGFRWPKEVGSEVVCPDWDPAPKCGNGLHGLLNGRQDGDLLYWDPDALWLVVEAEESDCVDLGGKWKFSKCAVVASGSRKEATDFLVNAGCIGVHGATVTGGDWATVTGGKRATVTGGDWATVTGGKRATVTGGDWATVTGGDGATVTGGDWATLTGGDWATVTGGKRATVTGGKRATVTGGDWATVTGGDGATLTGGDWATLLLSWWDSTHSRKRIVIAYVGEGRILPNTPYRLNSNHEFEIAK